MVRMSPQRNGRRRSNHPSIRRARQTLSNTTGGDESDAIVLKTNNQKLFYGIRILYYFGNLS